MPLQETSSYDKQLSRVVRKPAFCICKNKDTDQLAVTAKLISAFVFAKRIVQFLYFLNPKFQTSSHLMWLYSPVCVGPGQKPRRPVFSQQGSIIRIITFIFALYFDEVYEVQNVFQVKVLTEG